MDEGGQSRLRVKELDSTARAHEHCERKGLLLPERLAQYVPPAPRQASPPSPTPSLEDRLTTEISYEELANLIRTRTGVQVSTDELAHPDRTFSDLGMDSVGVLGVLADLENRYGVSLDGSDLTGSSIPEFLAAVNSTVKAGA